VEKKFPELIAGIDGEWFQEGPISVMFQDEARFGRISDTRRCWCPRPIRPLCQSMVTREYTYAYAAVSVADGVLDSLILPHTNSDCMQVFLDEVSSRHPGDRIIMILDGAGWHTSGLLTIPENMRLVPLPPYAPGTEPHGTPLGRTERKVFPQPRIRKHRRDRESLGDIPQRPGAGPGARPLHCGMALDNKFTHGLEVE
jgi:hypothetical protein